LTPDKSGCSPAPQPVTTPPTPQERPAPQEIPADETKPEPETKPAVVVKPVDEVKPLVEVKPAVEVNPVKQAEQERDNERRRVEQREREEREKLIARIKHEQMEKEERERAEAQKKNVTEPTESDKPVKDQNTAPVIEHIETKVERLSGPKISGTMDLSQFEKKKTEQKPSTKESHKGKRERIRKPNKEKVDLSKESKDNAFRPGADKNRPNPNKKGDKKPIGKEKFKPVRA
jgi:translation initiation factor IF-2